MEGVLGTCLNEGSNKSFVLHKRMANGGNYSKILLTRTLGGPERFL